MAQQQPIFILPEGAMRSRGRDAQGNNIMAARQVADAVRTTLGPRGMDKMLVDDLGDVTITNDGATIVDELDVEHPAAKMMVEVANTQDEEVGDGTTTAVVLSGELLHEAEDLLDQDIHPTIIAKGYRMAAEKAHEILEEMSRKVTKDDTDTLKKIAVTTMTGKGAEHARDYLAELAVKGVRQVTGDSRIDLDDIKIEKKEGKSIADTELVQGIIIDKERVHSGMPKEVEEAKIALVNVALEVKKTETDAKINITSPEQLDGFLKQEESMIKEMVQKVKKSGANVLLGQKGIDDLAQHYLSQEGILAIRRVKKSDMEKLAKATGARIVTSLDDLKSKDLGYAKTVEEQKIGGGEMTFIKGCENPKAVSVLVRGGTEHVVDEVERSVNDAIGGVASAIESGKVVAGGGAPEMEVAKGLREHADKIGGREQLAINAFADALEVMPRTLAESAGIDAVDALVELRTSHEKDPEIGLNVFTRNYENMWKLGVIEPLKIKTQAIRSASEAAEMVLRIDDVIASAGKKGEGGGGAPGGPGGMPPGAGGMPPGAMPGM